MLGEEIGYFLSGVTALIFGRDSRLLKRRKADGKGKMEIIRCLKRFVAGEIFGYLLISP
jgi:hypothetical protein